VAGVAVDVAEIEVDSVETEAEIEADSAETEEGTEVDMAGIGADMVATEVATEVGGEETLEEALVDQVAMICLEVGQTAQVAGGKNLFSLMDELYKIGWLAGVCSFSFVISMGV